MIYQELTLAPHLSVEENMTLGMERTRFGFLRSQTQKVEAALQLLEAEDILSSRKVRSLTIARQQIVEIARAIVSEARVVIMDEPTSSLSGDDKQALFRVIRKLRDEGLAIVYISHFLDEIDEIADRYTVLRDGESVGQGVVAESTPESLVEQMIGRTIDEMYPRPDHDTGEVVLAVKTVHGTALPRGVSFDLQGREILGIFGLVGAIRRASFQLRLGMLTQCSQSILLGPTGLRRLEAQVHRALRPVIVLAKGRQQPCRKLPALTIWLAPIPFHVGIAPACFAASSVPQLPASMRRALAGPRAHGPHGPRATQVTYCCCCGMQPGGNRLCCRRREHEGGGSRREKDGVHRREGPPEAAWTRPGRPLTGRH